MGIPTIPVKFVIYKSKAGFDSLLTREEDTLYFVRETLQFYQGSYDYNSVIAVETLPIVGIPLKIYLVAGMSVYLRTTSSWILLNEESQGGGSTTPTDYDGVTLNGKGIGGVKAYIETNDILVIPEFWQYNIKNLLSLDGLIVNGGEIYID